MLQWLDAAGDLASLAICLWWYVVVPIATLAGAYVYIRRSPSVNFGIAREYEQEGKLDRALIYYRRMAAHARSGSAEERIAWDKVDELEDRIAGGAREPHAPRRPGGAP